MSKDNTVWVLTVDYYQDALFPPNFIPEVYTDEELAEERRTELMADRLDPSDYWFYVDEVVLNKKQKDI